MSRLLLVDDNPDLVMAQITHGLGPLGLSIDVARSGAEGLQSVLNDPPDVVLLDVHLPDLSGLEVYRRIREVDARLPVVFITSATDADTAIEAMKQGAYDYLFKPLDVPQLRHVMSQAIQLTRLMREPATMSETPCPTDADTDAGHTIIGCSAGMREVYKAIGRVAPQNMIVLIAGESGTGKELIARAIYQHSARAHMPFHAINCAAIPETLLESELFGHEKGAFTGADRRRIGRFEQCSGGTLLLDEIGDMPLAMQSKLLRLLQEQTFERLGGNETVKTDVRLISATHRDLKALAVAGKFRADLYYRLSVFTISLPPLRERGEDLPLLVRKFIRQFNREFGRQVRDVHTEAMQRLQSYSWPGNVRELQSVLKQAMLQASGSILLPIFLPDPLDGARAPIPIAPNRSITDFSFESFIRQYLQTGSTDIYHESHRQLDRILLPIVLEFAEGNHRLAARLLGIARQTFRQRLCEANITTAAVPDEPGDSPGEGEKR
jgi:DNA-binding NtrC family response regulator